MKLKLVIALSALGLSGCDSSEKSTADNTELDRTAEIQALLDKAERQLVFVEGGTFQMGDFGRIDPNAEYLSYTYNLNDKHLHEVRLDDFWLGSRQVTYAEYDLYAEVTGRPLTNNDSERYSARFRAANTPVGVDWYQARDYCVWLAEQTGQPFALPTEAQWEYAARSRGELRVFATDTGQLDPGVNAATSKERRPTRISGAPPDVYEVDAFPPNPLGLYRMATNGYEWVNDWYAEDYYARSPRDNPLGPAAGTEKVLRGGGFTASPVGMMTMYRASSRPDLTWDVSHIENPRVAESLRQQLPTETTFRCAVTPSVAPVD